MTSPSPPRLLCFSPFYTDKLENSDQSERLWFLGIELVTTLLSTLEVKLPKLHRYYSKVSNFSAVYNSWPQILKSNRSLLTDEVCGGGGAVCVYQTGEVNAGYGLSTYWLLTHYRGRVPQQTALQSSPLHRHVAFEVIRKLQLSVKCSVLPWGFRDT